jgi:hypothetical protein
MKDLKSGIGPERRMKRKRKERFLFAQFTLFCSYYRYSIFALIRNNEGVLSPQVAVNEVAVPEVGCARNNLVAGFEAVDTAGVEPAAGRYLGRARNVSFEQNVLFLYRRVRDGDVGQQRFGVRV